MTLIQFADLMKGLGYKAEEAEREKVKATPVVEAKPEGELDAATEDTPTDVASDEAKAEDTPSEATEEQPPEMETFFTFRWGGNSGGKNPQRHAKPQGEGKGRGRKPKGKPQGKGNKAQNFQARPPRKEKAIDPDNPFAAALMGLKTKE